MKRLFDIISSGIGILILAPILTIIALIILISSKGGILYKQSRVGKNGIDFLF